LLCHLLDLLLRTRKQTAGFSKGNKDDLNIQFLLLLFNSSALYDGNTILFYFSLVIFEKKQTKNVKMNNNKKKDFQS